VSFPIIAAIFAEWEMLQERQVGPTARFVFIALANRMNKKSGRCDPSYEELAQDTGLSRSAVASGVDDLWHAGLIDWRVQRKIGTKQNLSNRYVIPTKPDPQDPEKKVLLQPAEPRPLSQKEQDMATAKALRRAKAKSGCRTVNQADESPVAGIGIPATAIGIPAERLKPGTQPGKKLDENGNVVVVVGSTEQGDGDLHFISTVDGEGHQGTDMSGDPDNDRGTMGTESSEVDGDPGEQREGKTGGTDISGEHHHHNQDQPDYVDGDGVLSGEYETCPPQQEGERETAAPESRTAAPAAQPTSLVEARELAKFYFESIGSPAQFKDRAKDWVKIALEMLGQNSLEDLKGAARYGLSHKKFWQPKLMQFDRDPFGYFQRCLNSDDPNSLLAQYRGLKNAHALNQQHKKQEAPHGQKTTTGKSRQQARADSIRAAGEEAERAIRLRYGATE